MTVAEAMGFDFGAMVPSRDAPPSEGDRGAPASPFGRPAADAKAPQPAARSNDVSLNWPPSMSGGQGAAAPAATNGSATPKPDAMSALTAKPAGGPELTAPARDNANPTTETKAASGLGAAVESASKFFSASPAPAAGAPSAAAPTPTAAEAKLVPVPGQSVSGQPASGLPSQDPSRPAQKEPLIAGFSPVKSTPAPAHNERPSERPAAPAFGAAKPAPAAAPEAKPDAVGVPSIEPVLKAFGRIGGKEDDSAAKPATSETKADIPAKDAGAKPAAAVPATIHLPGPAATTTAAPQPAAPATRTLEDAVMELLRPMLKEWLDDNLPRIIEDAVRKEVAGAVKNAGLSSKL